MRTRVFGVVLLSLAAAGCGGSKESEVPKNPVPMQKPGQSATPQGTKTGGAQPGQKVQPLPAK